MLDDFGQIGRSYREIDESQADKETLIRDLISGQYNNPVRIVCFNTAEDWSRDVTEDIAREIKERTDQSREYLSPGLRDFIDWQLAWESERGTLRASFKYERGGGWHAGRRSVAGSQNPAAPIAGRWGSHALELQSGQTRKVRKLQ